MYNKIIINNNNNNYYYYTKYFINKRFFYNNNDKINNIINDIISKKPIPGGGSCSSLVGSIGTAVGGMSLNYSNNEKNLNILNDSTKKLLKLCDDDMNAYLNLQKLWDKELKNKLTKDEIYKIKNDALNIPITMINEIFKNSELLYNELYINNGIKNSIKSDAKVSLHLLNGAAKAAYEIVLVNKPLNNIKYDIEKKLKIIESNANASMIKKENNNKKKKQLNNNNNINNNYNDENNFSILNTIGNTPIIKLSNNFFNKLNINKGNGNIFVKLEYFNPGYSKKDRIAKQMIIDALNDGTLKKDQTVVELTSGNTGTGLAIVCKSLNIPFIAVMSKGNSIERVKQMEAFGAEVILVDQLPNSIKGQVSGDDLKLVEEMTQKIVIEKNAFRANQFTLESNIKAHYEHTAFEIVNQIKPYQINSFVDFIGTTGTFTGCSLYFKEYSNNKIKCNIIIPNNEKHKIQGGGYGTDDNKFYDIAINKNLIDDKIIINDKDAINMARLLASEEGIFGGFSTGANVYGAIELLKKNSDQNIVTLACDTGLKYLSTDLYY